MSHLVLPNYSAFLMPYIQMKREFQAHLFYLTERQLEIRHIGMALYGWRTTIIFIMQVSMLV